MRPLLYVSICLSSLLLAGCHGSSPGPFSRGYSSYDKEFKSAPGQQARSVGYEYGADMNNAVIDDMRHAVHDLVEKMDAKLSFSVDELYLDNPSNAAFYNSFDHLLREELTHQGYLLAHNDTENSVRIDFIAKKASYCDNAEMRGGYKNNMYLALAIGSVDGVSGDVVGGFYDVPTYGYVNINNVKIDVPLSCSSDHQQE